MQVEAAFLFTKCMVCQNIFQGHLSHIDPTWIGGKVKTQFVLSIMVQTTKLALHKIYIIHCIVFKAC